MKYSVAMRMLLFPSNFDECLALVNKLLDLFCKGCITLHGKGFLSYNVHNVLHLVNDNKLYGSLDLFSCFGFESFLGKLKTVCNHVTSPFNKLLSLFGMKMTKFSKILVMNMKGLATHFTLFSMIQI